MAKEPADRYVSAGDFARAAGATQVREGAPLDDRGEHGAGGGVADDVRDEQPRRVRADVDAGAAHGAASVAAMSVGRTGGLRHHGPP